MIQEAGATQAALHRHSREGGNPATAAHTWIPACAGMTAWGLMACWLAVVLGVALPHENPLSPCAEPSPRHSAP